MNSSPLTRASYQVRERIKSGSRLRIFILATFLLLGALAVNAQARQCLPKDVQVAKGRTSVVVRRQLEPCAARVYRFRARVGQRMLVSLRPENNDVAFVIQGSKFLPERGSFVLEGVHKSGITDWDGILPNDDVYEIWVGRPPVSNSRQARTLPFRLRVEITGKAQNERNR